MLLRIFICYGGREGERIGVNLREFLRSEGLTAFLASPSSPDAPAGVNYQEFIDGKLLTSHLMIPICDSGIHRSGAALREICVAINVQKPIPILAFTKKKCRLPDLIKGKWEPVRFDPQNPKSAYQRLLIEIYRRIDYEREKIEDLRMARPTELPISRALKKLLRGR
jgi:hypothetical protein